MVNVCVGSVFVSGQWGYVHTIMTVNFEKFKEKATDFENLVLYLLSVV